MQGISKFKFAFNYPYQPMTNNLNRYQYLVEVKITIINLHKTKISRKKLQKQF